MPGVGQNNWFLQLFFKISFSKRIATIFLGLSVPRPISPKLHGVLKGLILKTERLEGFQQEQNKQLLLQLDESCKDQVSHSSLRWIYFFWLRRLLYRGFPDSQCLIERSAGLTDFAAGGARVLGRGRRLRGGWESSPPLKEPSVVMISSHEGKHCSCYVSVGHS